MISARQAALTALERCRRDGAWSGQVLDRMLASGELDERESALAVRLCLGVLQNSRYLDHYIDLCCTAPKLEPKLRDILRLGAYQLLLLDKIPAHAAVDETVSLCRTSGLGRASGLVNAVLRRLSEHRSDLPEIPGIGTCSYLALRYSQSDWLAKELTGQRGYAFTESFFQACQMPAPTDLQINTLKTDADALTHLFSSSGLTPETHAWPENCFSVSSGKVESLPGFREGLFYVQDRAAAMAVEISGVKPDMRVLDLCAAPGGKSFAAALQMKDRGEILSCDLHEKKLRLIRSGAERLGLESIRTMPNDARIQRPEWTDSFDLVIADVPCSGFGVMRKKPEIRTKQCEEVSALPALQLQILQTAAGYVKPGGTLLYSTCTVLQQENENVVSAFLSENADFAPADFQIGDARSENGCYTFWPQIDVTDGFFAAKLIRRSP